MADEKKLQREKLNQLLARNIHPDLDLTSYQGVFELIERDERITKNKPTEVLYHPKKKKYIINCSQRSYRPQPRKGDSCAICEGDTTSVILENRTETTPFINLNLFPYRHPCGIPVNSLSKEDKKTPLDFVVGGSFLQWHTTEHKEIHQLTYEQYLENLLQLQEFERLLGEEINFKGKVYPAYFEIFKNVGRSAGRSIPHGHHQIQFGNLGAPEIENNGFEKEEVKIRSYGNVTISAPADVEFPLEVIIYPEQGIEKIMDADRKTLENMAIATVNTSRALYHLMPRRNEDLAYNLVFFTRKGVGRMYIQVKPKTQIIAGSELSGLHVRPMTEKKTAELYKEILKQVEEHRPEDYKLEPE